MPNPSVVDYRKAQASDAEALADLRVRAMRPSLEAVGRFDPVRARKRFLDGFVPDQTQVLEYDGSIVGFFVVRSAPTHLLLDHLYIAPQQQGRGIGAEVLRRVACTADAARLPLRVGALKGSRANTFYQRQGFTLVEQSEWDNHYVRQPRPAG
ncbi:MAG: GNAT family N-acetyltransferase [Burkholderiaceae bacterium]|jgi:GNAT superfamily N-acetyltransferase|nr:GNAT family N-acetyltransferase [Burkholderiales bacterium]MCE2644911.1 GNAT family N-acetyltransferase [Burkholderiaceae bacterium]